MVEKDKKIISIGLVCFIIGVLVGSIVVGILSEPFLSNITEEENMKIIDYNKVSEQKGKITVVGDRFVNKVIVEGDNYTVTNYVGKNSVMVYGGEKVIKVKYGEKEKIMTVPNY